MSDSPWINVSVGFHMLGLFWKSALRIPLENLDWRLDILDNKEVAAGGY